MEESDNDLSGLDMATGSVEEAQKWIGKKGDVQYCPIPVERSLIRYYASMLEDGNPVYWDEEFARQTWNGVCAPPGSLLNWKMPHLWWWTPDSATESRSVGRVMFATQVPLPPEHSKMAVEQSVETTFERPIRAGDRLSWQETILDVSDAKETRIGTGHFISSETSYWNQDGALVAKNRYTMFRHGSDTEGASDGTSPDAIKPPLADNPSLEERHPVTDRYRSITIDEVSPDDVVTSFKFPVTYRTVIQNAAATLDLYPGHNDPVYARQQGNNTIYLNTMALQGLVDRMVLDWAGPRWQIKERRVEFRGSAEVGVVLTLTGQVESISTEDEEITIEGGIYNEGDALCVATITIGRGFDS